MVIIVNFFHLMMIISFAGRLTSQPVRNGSYVSHIKNATMNEMPVPSGSWAEHNSAKQKSYNLHLMAGIAFTTVTVIFVS
jgi:hypothetical protein